MNSKNTQRIALFLPSLSGGGAEKVALLLATEFAERGYYVDMVLSKATGEFLNLIPDKIRVIDLQASRPLKAIPNLVHYLINERPTALLSKITNANVAALLAIWLARTKTRCVVCEESTFSIDLANTSRLNRLLLPKILRYFYPKAHAVVAVSQGVADDFVKMIGLPQQLIRVIYNPVMPRTVLSQLREAVNHRWLHSDGVPIIIGIGRLTRQKDFPTLIRAFAHVRKLLPLRLIILGEGEDRADLENLCHSLGVAADVDLVGFVANPYAFLSRADLFVLSSRWEGFGNVLLEALNVGVPVISTDCPNGPKEILKEGKYGQLVPTGDDEAMAAAMMRVLNGEFVAADVADPLSLFRTEANVDRYLELLVN